MLRNERGFNLVELLLAMTVFVLLMAASSQVLVALVTQFKQQSKIAQTSIEGAVGLEMLRKDLSHAGFGLPWDMGGAAYQEAVNDANTRQDDTAYNDAGTGVPRAILNGQNVGITNVAANTTSDVLVIKGTNMALNDASQKWTYISNRGAWSTVLTWGSLSNDSFANGDKLIVVAPVDGALQRSLKWANTFYTTFGDSMGPQPPPNSFLTYVAYGLTQTETPRMPFNRVDYYVMRPATGMPSRCAPNTGVLYRATLNHTDGNHTSLPILDCVVDLKVDFWLDTDADGAINWPPVNTLGAMTADQIRTQLQEVRVYIVAQDGQRDVNYDFSNAGAREFVTVVETLRDPTEASPGMSRQLDGTNFFANLRALIGDPEYKYYRWKVYSVIVKPSNLR